MNDRVKAFWLGIFIIIGIIITTWLVLFLKPSVGDGKTTLTVRFSNIDKVEEGTRVTFAGKPVGEVKKIVEISDPRLSPSDEFGNLFIYELTLKVDSSVHVYQYDEILFASSGLLGEKSIAIMPKAAPPGAPPPQEVTNQVLFARSTDKLEKTLNQLTQVADSFEDTMEGLNEFLSTNSDDFNAALKSVKGVADEVLIFVADANEREFNVSAIRAADAIALAMERTDVLIQEVQEHSLVERTGRSLDNFYSVSDKISKGEGSLGRLLNSEDFYYQISTVVCRIETLLNDINNYGLLFQYNKKWQRLHRMRQEQEEACCFELEPCGEN